MGRRAFSTAHNVKVLGVIGAGQMGSGIAQVAAQIAKVPVIIVDKDAGRIQSSMQFMGIIL